MEGEGVKGPVEQEKMSLADGFPNESGVLLVVSLPKLIKSESGYLLGGVELTVAHCACVSTPSDALVKRE